MAIFSLTYLLMFSATMLILILGLLLFDFEKIDKKKYFLLIAIGFVVTRILSIFYMYGLAGFSGTSDLNNIFAHQANQVLQGNIPYLDFESHYSPYFPYLISLPYLIYNQPVSVLSVFIIFDLLTLVVGGLYISESWDLKHKHKFYWIYSYIPLTWLFISFWNQDEVISAFFLVVSMLLIYRKQEQKAAICMAIGFLFTKFLIAIFFIPLFLMMQKPVRNGILTGGLILLGYLPFIVIGADVLMPFTSEAGYLAVGSNLWVILEAIGVIVPWYLPHIIVLTSLALLAIIYSTSDRLHHLSPEATIVLFSLVYMMLGKKSFSFYVPFFLVFMIILFLRLVTTEENRKFIIFIFFTYVVTFSLLYPSVVILKMMQVQTFDWILAFAIYSAAILSQVVVLWIIARSKYHQPTFYYWSFHSWVQSIKERFQDRATQPQLEIESLSDQ